MPKKYKLVSRLKKKSLGPIENEKLISSFVKYHFQRLLPYQQSDTYLIIVDTEYSVNM